MEAKIVIWSKPTTKGDYLLKLRLSDGKKFDYLPVPGIKVMPDPNTPLIKKPNYQRKDKDGNPIKKVTFNKLPEIPEKSIQGCLLWDVRRQVLSEVSKPRKPNEAKQAEYDRYIWAKGILDALLKKYTDKTDELLKEGRNTTIDQLIDKVENRVKIITVYEYFNNLIKNFTAANKLGQARIHEMTLRSLKDFAPKEIRFHDIDLHWLKRYENYLKRKSIKDAQGVVLRKGLKDTTISIYFRTLRAVYNSAIGEGFAKQIEYPFGKKQDNKTFTVSSIDVTTPKRAITREQLEAFEAVEGLTPEQEKAREIALFSYYVAGINFNDICKLRWANFDGIHINYTRAKTHTKMKTYLLPYAKNVIQNLRKQTGIDPENYIFPILNYHIHESLIQIENRIHKVLGQTNKGIKEVAKLAGIKENLSTYSFRHSFITHTAQNRNLSPYELRDLVGHKDLKTTMIYVTAANSEQLDDCMQRALIAK